MFHAGEWYTYTNKYDHGRRQFRFEFFYILFYAVVPGSSLDKYRYGVHLRDI